MHHALREVGDYPGQVMETRDCPHVLIIGIGNESRGDDALGLHVARTLAGMDISGIEVVERDGEGTSLIETWRGHDCVLLIDAFSSGSAPGMVHSVDATITQIHSEQFRSSSHTFGVAQAIELSRRLNLLPSRLFIYGVEGKSFKIGADISRPVRDRIPGLVETIVLQISELHLELLHHLHRREIY